MQVRVLPDSLILKQKTMSENQLSVKNFFQRDAVKAKFNELLGAKSTGFITSVMQVVNSNSLLKNATPESIYNASAMAAILDLQINNNIGHAWIVPYKGQAQFQIGWKGFVQLAKRSGQYKAINVIEVYENQLKSYNRLTEELDGDFTLQPSGKVVGYVAYFKELNGFEKTSYWTIEDVQAHGRKFSKTFLKSDGAWQTNFDAMAKKTVIKNTLAKWGTLSIEMQKAIVADQGVINDAETLDVEYTDEGSAQVLQTMPTLTDDEVKEAILDGITLEALQSTYELTNEQIALFQ